MKKQIILTTAIVFVGLYFLNGFINLELDFRCWSYHNRIGYVFVSAFYSIISSVMIIIFSNLD